MVRMQVEHRLAFAGDHAAIDFLATEKDTGRHSRSRCCSRIPGSFENPSNLFTCFPRSRTGWTTTACHRRAASPFCRDGVSPTKNHVLVDLLADDVEIVIIQQGIVRSIRTIRLPNDSSRGRSLVSEIKRSLVTSGEDAHPDQLVLWGDETVHCDDLDSLRNTFDFPVVVINPFAWISSDPKSLSELPIHSGRFAPLIGLLVADQAHPEWLIDFLNPRKRYEAPPNHRKKALFAGIPLLVAAVLGYLVLGQFRSFDDQIKDAPGRKYCNETQCRQRNSQHCTDRKGGPIP